MNKTTIKKIYIILTILQFLVTYSDAQIRVENDIFNIIYSEKYQQPIIIEYSLMCSKGGISRKNMNFFGVDSILTSDDNDYYNNIWDKGHMVPSGSFNCDKSLMTETFSYLNCALQHEKLNRGPWKTLEEFELELFKIYNDVDVMIILHFNEDNRNWLPTGALVPLGFTKIIKTPHFIIEWYFENQDPKGRKLKDYIK